jgi:predicted CoA-binding protein
VKYGNIILRDLVRKGFTVIPVNPGEERIEGLTVFARASDIPDPVHIVNFVVPPEVSVEVLEELDPARFHIVWFQPGSYDRAVLARAHQKFEHVIGGDCIMVETR